MDPASLPEPMGKHWIHSDAGKSRYDWQPANGCGYALELLPDTPPRLLGSIPVTSLK